MKKELEKVPVRRKDGSIRQYRKETNDQILARNVEQYGFAQLSMSLRIYDRERTWMVGYQGANVTVNAKTIEAARRFRDAIRVAAARICETDPELEMPDAIIYKEG